MAEQAPVPPGEERATRLSNAASLPVGPCARCEREVLGVRSVDEPDGYACAHCDGRLRHVYWVDEGDLAALGYDAWDPLAAGCGSGCANGGCGVRR